MHEFFVFETNWGLCKVANDTGQFDDMKPIPPVAVAEESPRETELSVSKLHRLFCEWQVFAHKDVGCLYLGAVRGWMLEAKY